LPQLLTEYFRIMNEIGNDEVVSALQVLLDKFGDHIEPHAVALVKELSNAFSQYCSAGEDEDDDDAALAAAQCLECIATVLKGVCSKESMLATLEPLLLPLVLRILGNDGNFIEYLECALDILTFLTYFQSTLSMELWQAFPLIYVAFDQWAYDYLSMMVPCLQSYISKAPDVFLAGVAQLPHLQQSPDGSPTPAAPTISYLDLVISMASKTVTNDRASEPECRYALSLLMCVLHNCPGKVDPYIPFMNDIILGKLGQQIHSQVPLTRIAIYQVLGSALYYQPQLELMELEKRAVTGQVFGQWLTDCDSMSRWLPRKCTILGFASIFSMPTATFPPSITNILPQLFAKSVKVALDQYQDENPDDDALVTDNAEAVGGGLNTSSGGADQNVEGRTASMTTTSNFEEDVGDLDQGFDENEDVTNEVDEAYRKALSGVKNWDDDMAKFLMGEFDEDGEDVDEDYSSPLVDQVDEKLLLADIFKVASTREPEAYQQIQAALPPEDVASCQRLFAIVDSVRADQAARQASQQQ
jgi:importin-7